MTRNKFDPLRRNFIVSIVISCLLAFAFSLSAARCSRSPRDRVPQVKLDERARLSIRALMSVPSAHAGTRPPPLCTDASGWTIVGAKPAEGWANDFASKRAEGYDFGDLYAVLRYVYHHEPSRYAMLFWYVPEGMTLTWTQDSRMIVTAVADGDTLTASASQIITTNIGRRWAGLRFEDVFGDRISISSRVYPDDPEPTRSINISQENGCFATERGEIIVFARFEFGDRAPQRLVRLSISGVSAARR